ncbi:MAG: biotin/lipoyl-binding protein [Paludibacteraceae bacterium]|nr:biotin/lipoyl-binding protein [Paludibacteraceae bacterium]
MKKNNAVLIVAVIVIAVILGVILTGLTMSEPQPVLQGEVEISDYRLSSKVPSRVKEIKVEEGDYVNKGDTLVIMEAPEVEAKLSQAEAAKRAAQALQSKAQAGTRSEQIQGAYEMWQKAKAGLEVYEKTYQRVQKLHNEGVVAAQKLDEAKAQYDAAVATEKAAKAQYDMAMNGAQAEDKQAAAAQVARAKGAIAEVNSYINETIIVALASGRVTEIFPEVGELVGSGAPIMNVAKTDGAFFTFNIREDLLKGLEVGAEKDVYIVAKDTTVKAKVSKMKDVGSYAVWKATKANGQYDLKTIEVQLRPVDKVDGLVSGMSAIIK